MTNKYYDAVAWIAHNDNPGDNESADDIATYLTTLLVADVFGATPIEVAVAVWRLRNKVKVQP